MTVTFCRKKVDAQMTLIMFVMNFWLNICFVGKIIPVVMFCTWSWKCFQVVVTVLSFLFKTTLLKEMEKKMAFRLNNYRHAVPVGWDRTSPAEALYNCGKQCSHPWAFKYSLACTDIQYELYTCSFLIKGRESSEIYWTQWLTVR